MAEITAVAHAAFLVKTVNYVNVASCTFLVADYFHTLELEVELIWSAKWGLIKLLFLLARYSAFFDVSLLLYYSLAPNLSNQECLIMFSIISASILFGIEIAEAILLVRTYALSGNSRNILIYLLIQFVVILTSLIIVLTIFLRSLEYGTSPLPTLIGCYLVKSSKILPAASALITFGESALMVLTIWMGVRSYRHSRDPLVTTLYRDGIFYFVYLFLISGVNIVVLVAGPPVFTELITTFQRVMHSILSTRIVLHIRNAGRDQDTAFTISDLRFGSRPDQQKVYQSSRDQSTTTTESIELE